MTIEKPTGPAGTASAAQPPTLHQCTCQQRAERAEAALAEQRRQTRQYLRDRVVAGDFDTDVTNDLLTALDLPPLPRHWTVTTRTTLTVTVVADSSDDAFDTARDVIENAVDQIGADADFDVMDVGQAIPGELADDSVANPVAAAVHHPTRA
ncbi:hypothetical protein [Dactylosporangium sp. NPDC048998]|uniref:hypothetical protein n=1 Tax=Dactylosporangium sp. NPDC048998 TaxID=3363976 RepID=UPI0037242079